MKSDALFYRLFEASPETFFLLNGQPAEMAAEYEFLALEFKETATRADGVFRPRKAGQPIYFLEVQFYRKPTVYADLLVKMAHYLKNYDPAQPCRGVVLFAKRSLEPLDCEPYRPLLDAGYFKAIYLDALHEVPGAPLGISILHLIREPEATVGQKAKPLIARVKSEIGDEGIRQEMVELVETVVMYKLSQLTREEIQAMLEVDDIRETRVYKDAMLEGRLEGLLEGESKGRLEGESKGRLEGESKGKMEALRNMHGKKFSAELIAEILAVDVDFVRQEIDRLEQGNA